MCAHCTRFFLTLKYPLPRLGAVRTFTKLRPSGALPAPRKRSSLAVVGAKLYVVGGTNDKEWFEDICVMNTALKSWTKIKGTGATPSGRAGHSASVIGNNIYVFGGENATGALGDFFSLDASKSILRLDDLICFSQKFMVCSRCTRNCTKPKTFSRICRHRYQDLHLWW